MKGAVALIIAFALVIAAMVALSGMTQLSVTTEYSYFPDITTDKQSYVAADTISFGIHLLEQNNTDFRMNEAADAFAVTVKLDTSASSPILAALTGTSPILFQYPASALMFGSTSFYFDFAIPDMRRSLLETKDVKVTQAPEIDTTPPSILYYGTVGSSDQNVVTDTQVFLVFSEPVQPIATSDFYISTSSSSIAGTILQTGERAVLTPSSELRYETQYTVTVSNIRDLAGNVMPDFHWAFRTTGDGYPPVVSIVYPVAILQQGYGLRQADVYDRSWSDARMPNAGEAVDNVLTLTGTATDVSGISSIVAHNEANGQTTAGTGGAMWSVPVTLVPDNNYNIITVTAKDPNGDAGTDRILVHYSTGGVQVIEVVFTQPSSIGPDGNGAYSTDKQSVNVSGHASYSYRDLVSISWHNNLTGEAGTAWSGRSHEANFSFTAGLVKGEDPIWVQVTDSAGFSTYRAFTAACTYTPPGPPVPPPIPPEPSGISLLNFIGAAACILLLAGLFLRFVFDIRIGWALIGIGLALLMIFGFGTLSQPPI